MGVNGTVAQCRFRFQSKEDTWPVVLAADKTATQDFEGLGQAGFEHASRECLKTEPAKMQLLWEIFPPSNPLLAK